MATINTSWGTRHLVLDLFAQDEYWVTASGQRYKISEMEKDHALHTLCYLERVAPEIHKQINKILQPAQLAVWHPSEWLVATKLYAALKARALEPTTHRTFIGCHFTGVTRFPEAEGAVNERKR